MCCRTILPFDLWVPLHISTNKCVSDSYSDELSCSILGQIWEVGNLDCLVTQCQSTSKARVLTYRSCSSWPMLSNGKILLPFHDRAKIWWCKHSQFQFLWWISFIDLLLPLCQMNSQFVHCVAKSTIAYSAMVSLDLPQTTMLWSVKSKWLGHLSCSKLGHSWM